MLPDLTDQFIADSYAGILHTSNVPVSETNLPQIYDGLGNKTSMKIGSEGGGASFTGTLSADGFAITGYASLIDFIYPVNSIYLSTDNINPQLRFLGTVWQQVVEAQGKFLAGVGLGNDGLNDKNITSGNNSGEYLNILSVSQLPAHTHTGVTGTVGSGGGAITSGEPTLLDSLQSFDHQNSGHTSASGTNKILKLDGQVFLNNTGTGTPVNNCPPSFGVYVWKRTS
jgi:hypothetical protein